MPTVFSGYLNRAMESHNDVVPAALIRYTFDLLDNDSTIAGVLKSQEAFAGYGKPQFHLSLFKLAAGLGTMSQLMLDPSKAPLQQGLGVLVVLATLGESVRKISLDEAAIVQALLDARDTSGSASLPRANLVDKLVAFTGSAENEAARYEAALSSLKGLHAIERDLAEDTVTLVDAVFIGRRRG